jgi:diadenosine tetraphosphate (Ap4A) HIT family hydrolase
MPTLFTRIIQGEIPGRFVWKDPAAVAFLSINPLRPGHTLVVPRLELDHWIDLPEPVANHLMSLSQKVGRAIQRAFNPAKVGVAVVGLEVPHVHIHLVPIDSAADLDFSRQDMNAKAADLDAAAEKIRKALEELGLRPPQS